MENKISILIIEDNPAECNSLIKQIDLNCEIMALAGVTDNTNKALEMLVDAHPDVIIMELEFHNGGGDGIDFLKKLKDSKLPRKPFIFIGSYNNSQVIHKAARSLGADFIMTKTQEGYSPAAIIELIKTTHGFILDREDVSTDRIDTSHGLTETSEKRYRRLINNEMNIIGINPKSVGYEYLVEAIMFVIKGSTQYLSDLVAAKFQKSTPAIERAMQNAINRAWNINDLTDMSTLYTARVSSSRGIPSITEFVFYYAKKIETEF